MAVLDVTGISFATAQVLEWPLDWAKYRTRPVEDRKRMDPADQVELPFYDAKLRLVEAWSGGVTFQLRQPVTPKPHVAASLTLGGHMDEHWGGFELVIPGGPVQKNMGGGGGDYFPDAEHQAWRQGGGPMWGDDVPEPFKAADRLIVRYVHPSGTMLLEPETWPLVGAPK